MLNTINLKKLTANTLLGILLVGGLVVKSSEKSAIATNTFTSCNHGHGNNNAASTVYFTLSDGSQAYVSVSKFDPSNSGNINNSGNPNGKKLQLINALKAKQTSSNGMTISYSGYSGSGLTASEALYVANNVQDLETSCDSDGDNIYDATEGEQDLDNDGLPNYKDTDSDGDGISDQNEGTTDTDNDGIKNYLDTDSDGDGISDNNEGTGDSDGDGIANYLDYASNSSFNITGTLTADNHYGLFTGNDNGSDLTFIGRNEIGPSGNPGTYNWSKAETWNFFLDDNDYIYVVVWDDSNVDESWIGQFVPNTGDTLLTLNNSWEYMISNSANPGDYGAVPSNSQLQSEISGGNWISAKRRGDNGMSPWGTIAGVSSSADFLNTTTPSNGKYTIFRTKFAVKPEIAPNADADNDGILDSVEIGSNPDNPIDTDNDGTPDYLDTDSDGDGVNDITEGGSDDDNDGTPDYLDTDVDGDSDGDGILDSVEGTTDSDNDGTANYLDTDSDDDGIADSVEVGSDVDHPIDSDNDGTPDYLDTDSDGDSILDSVEGTTDTDNDGIKNYLDTDSDNDGITDSVEGTTDTDNDGTKNYLDTDSDDDGIADSVEGTTDSDGDGTANYLDTDSDGDGLLDTHEKIGDANGDGTPDTPNGQVNDDVDDDGTKNYLDTNSDDDNYPDNEDPNPYQVNYSD